MNVVLLFFVALLAFTGCAADPAVLLNAPPEFDQGDVYVDGRFVGKLQTTHNYRVGRYAAQREMAAPPRHEANLAIQRLPLGKHTLRVVKSGYAEYRATFQNNSAHVEVFVPDEAVRRPGG